MAEDDAELVTQTAAQLDCDEDAAREFLDTLDHAVGSVCPLCGEGYIVEADDERWFPSRGRQSRSVNLGVMQLSLSKARELDEDEVSGLENPYFCTSGNDSETCVLAGQFEEVVGVRTLRGVEETARRHERRRSYVDRRLGALRDRLE
ncbi:hypothetical protein [Haloarchaeobius amylolyticus]|uniref:hypothetical protein n=1 Tax=Haloarchaeobius amylolyticus TaxID=1198296 RepID=UPI002270559D|nr:hypothetical protein [Haloarchaeobius amylolyticus]